ncbi:hypothetical protein ATANTOWER_010894 [Ataeniobius toweri]|uniref:Uncharacterized protein n=1 Tax=Ataeniobius toweri TaxID=208326 RepID=A0ABU7BSL8_9TELE|nr:hypothetical protein [Ataeniobius toweri]
MIIHAFVSSCFIEIAGLLTGLLIDMSPHVYPKPDSAVKATKLLLMYFRVHFKILILPPGYIRGLLHPYVPSLPLRSCDEGLLIVLHTKMKTKGEKAFSSVAPRLKLEH